MGRVKGALKPYLRLMLIECLGPEYVVWDKAPTIRFRRPGRGTVNACFRISDEQLDEIRQALRTEPKVDGAFTVAVKDRNGKVITEVEKILHVSRRGGFGGNDLQALAQ
jgi:hypothetical protein